MLENFHHCTYTPCLFLRVRFQNSCKKVRKYMFKNHAKETKCNKDKNAFLDKNFFRLVLLLYSRVFFLHFLQPQNSCKKGKNFEYSKNKKRSKIIFQDSMQIKREKGKQKGCISGRN